MRARTSTPGREARGIADGLDRVFLQIVVLVALLALVLGGVFAYLIGSVRPEQSRYRTAAAALSRAHAAMIDQETGLRGYLLMNDSTYLQPYHQGVSVVEEENATLASTIGSDAGIAPLMLDMRVAEQSWQSEWASEVLADRMPTDRDGLAGFYERGKDLFDGYRTAEETLNDRLSARRDSLFVLQGRLLAGGLVATLVLGLLLVAAVLRQRRRLKEAVVAPVVDILAATDAIARHDLGTPVVPSGPDEFRRIGKSVNQVREALAEARERDRAAQQQIELQAGQLRNILAMSREIAGSLNVRYVLRTVADAATTVSGFPRALVWLCDDDPGTTLSAWYDSARAEGTPDSDLRVEVGVGVVGQAVRYGRTSTESEDGQSSVEVHPERKLHTLAVPLVVGARVTGAIEVSSPEAVLMIEGTVEILETLASHAAAAIESARLHSTTEQQAHTDALTGLLNRRRLDTDLALECERSARYQRPFALIMFDVDHFKRLNDTHGHTRGDEVLQQLAEVVEGSVRTTDSVYRYGGEEFTVLARETTAGDAHELAERLRVAIEQHFAGHGSPARVTASFGIGLVPPGRPEPAVVVANADAALYRAKAAGRNRVIGPGVPD